MLTIEDICIETRNYFPKEKLFGEFEIKDGALLVDDAKDGQYIRVIGSSLNDGLYLYPVENLEDETFKGAVWICSIPRAFTDLLERINQWTEKTAAVLDSPYKSESFGGYSYTKDDSSVSWQSKFKRELNRWRKLKE